MYLLIFPFLIRTKAIPFQVILEILYTHCMLSGHEKMPELRANPGQS